MVVGISFALVLILAGVAMGLSWSYSFVEEKQALQTEIQMVLNAVTSFSVQQALAREVWVTNNTRGISHIVWKIRYSSIFHVLNHQSDRS